VPTLLENAIGGGIIGRIGFILLYSYKCHAAFPELSGFPSGKSCAKTRPQTG
jgi:hypothetical protein